MKKYWPYLGFAVITLLFFSRFLTGAEVFAFKDLSRYFYPLRFLMVEQVKAGHLPLWNPYIFCGLPLLATLQIGFFYPLTLIHYFLPFNLAFNYYIIIHYFLAAVFMYLLMRHFGYEEVVSFLSGLVFAFSGYLLSVSNMNTSMSSVIWLPLVILFWDRSLSPQSPSTQHLSTLVPLILSLCMMFLGGEPTIIYVTAWLMLFYGLVFGVDWKKTLISLIVVFVFVAGIVAVQLIPFAELVYHSDRVMLTQFNLISMRSLPPREIINFVMPLFFGNQLRPGSYVPNVLGRQNQDWLLSTYIGLIPLMLVLFGLLRFNKKSNFWLGVLLVSLVLAFGSYTPLYRILFNIVPGISIIRYPVKYLFMAFFALSILAGLGFSKILAIFDSGNKDWFKRSSFILGLIFIVAGIICFFLKINYSRILDHYLAGAKGFPLYLTTQILTNVRFNIESYNNLLIMLFISVFALYSVYKSIIRRHVFCVFVLGVVILDLFSVNSPLNLPSDAAVYDKVMPNIKILQTQKQDYRIFYSSTFEAFNRLVYGEDFDQSILEAKDMLVANRALPYHISDFYGYESIMINDYRKFTMNFWGEMLGRKRSLLDVLNCKYLINGSPLKNRNLKLLNATEYFFGRSYLYENLSAKPRASLFSKAIFEPTRKDIQKQMKANVFNAKQLLYLEGKKKNIDYGDVKSKISQIAFDYDKMSMLIDGPKPVFLFVSDIYYPGWKAYIDNREVNIIRANLIFRALEVPKGVHKINFIYRPLSLIIGGAISFFTIFILLVLFLRKKVLGNRA